MLEVELMYHLSFYQFTGRNSRMRRWLIPSLWTSETSSKIMPVFLYWWLLSGQRNACAKLRSMTILEFECLYCFNKGTWDLKVRQLWQTNEIVSCFVFSLIIIYVARRELESVVTGHIYQVPCFSQAFLFFFFKNSFKVFPMVSSYLNCPAWGYVPVLSWELVMQSLQIKSLLVKSELENKKSKQWAIN